MTTIILIAIGLLLAGAAALFVIYYGGDSLDKMSDEAQAGRLVGEGAQVEAALELYYRQEGEYPRGENPVQQLIDADYLTHDPLGTYTQAKDLWHIDYDAAMIRALLGTTDNSKSLNICKTARRQLNLPDAPTKTTIYRCDVSDSPGGKISGREPCCIGDLSNGSGSSAPKTPEAIYAQACSSLSSMPVSTQDEKVAYAREVAQCLRGRAITAPTYLVSKANMDASGINFAAIANDYYVDTNQGGEVDVRLWFKSGLYDVMCAGLPTSADINSKAWCSNGYYRERVSSEYMPRQKAILDAGFAQIIDFATRNGISTTASYTNAGGPQPDFKGRGTSWSFADYNNGEFSVRAAMPNQSMCQWYRKVNGRTGDLQRDRQYGQYECYYSGATYYEQNVTDTVRPARYNRIKSEITKVVNTQANLDNAYTTSTYTAQGGYQPNFGDAATGWRFRDYNARMYAEAIINDGQCIWHRLKWGKSTDLDLYEEAPEWCGWDRQGGATRVYMFDITDSVRTRQFNIMRQEIEKLRLNPSYTPNFKGAASGWQYYNRDGHKYIEAFIDDNRCLWFRRQIGGSTNMDTFNPNVPEWCGWDGSGARRGFFVKLPPEGIPGGMNPPM